MARNFTGIRRVGDKWEVYGKAGARQFSRRFELDTPFSVMRAWREAQHDALATPKATVGSLEEGVAKLLKLESGRRAVDFGILLGHWVSAFPGKSRLMLTPAEIQAQLDTWKTQGVAASTLNHRRQALRSLYRRIEPDLPNPVDRTSKYREPEPEPRAVPDDLLVKIFEAMPESATKARLQIIMHTGMRHSELARVQPGDARLDDEQPHVFVRSGKGGRHRIVPLHALAVAAFRSLDAHKGWGTFSVDSARKSWLNALHKLGLAERVAKDGDVYFVNGAYRPYDLRHRFATRLRERGADLADVQDLLGHRSIQTTRRYAPAVQAKLVDRVNALMDPVPSAGGPAGEKPQTTAP